MAGESPLAEPAAEPVGLERFYVAEPEGWDDATLKAAVEAQRAERAARQAAAEAKEARRAAKLVK